MANRSDDRPDTARYFYRVEVRDFASRWFFWIDAETGAVTNEYDGFTTGTGIGVKGDTKDLGELTTFVNGTHALSTPRLTTYDARNRQTLPGVLATDADDAWNTPGRTSPGQPAMVDAHFYANVTDAFYQAARLQLVGALPAGHAVVGPLRPQLQQRGLERHADDLWRW